MVIPSPSGVEIEYGIKFTCNHTILYFFSQDRYPRLSNCVSNQTIFNDATEIEKPKQFCLLFYLVRILVGSKSLLHVVDNDMDSRLRCSSVADNSFRYSLARELSLPTCALQINRCVQMVQQLPPLVFDFFYFTTFTKLQKIMIYQNVAKFRNGREIEHGTQLYYRYGTRNSVRSIETPFKVAYNYERSKERRVVSWTSPDTRDGVGYVSSRIGMKTPTAIAIEETTDIFG